jgi:hypothetical protein
LLEKVLTCGPLLVGSGIFLEMMGIVGLFQRKLNLLKDRGSSRILWVPFLIAKDLPGKIGTFPEDVGSSPMCCNLPGSKE